MRVDYWRICNVRKMFMLVFLAACLSLALLTACDEEGVGDVYDECIDGVGALGGEYGLATEDSEDMSGDGEEEKYTPIVAALSAGEAAERRAAFEASHLFPGLFEPISYECEDGRGFAWWADAVYSRYGVVVTDEDLARAKAGRHYSWLDFITVKQFDIAVEYFRGRILGLIESAEAGVLDDEVAFLRTLDFAAGGLDANNFVFRDEFVPTFAHHFILDDYIFELGLHGWSTKSRQTLRYYDAIPFDDETDDPRRIIVRMLEAWEVVMIQFQMDVTPARYGTVITWDSQRFGRRLADWRSN